MNLKNSKKGIELSINQIIGFVLVAVVLVGFIGFSMKLWGIFLNKPNQATLNSFENLMHELNTLEEGEGKSKIIPFYIQKKLYLRTTCETYSGEYLGLEVLNDICICKGDHPCEKRLERDIITYIKEASESIIILNDPMQGQIGYEKDKEVRNLKLTRDDEGVKINIV